MGSLRRLPFYPPLDGDQGASLLLHHHQRRRRRGALRPLPLAIETDPDRYLADFPLSAVGEIHLAGYAEDKDDAGLPLLIDAHNSPVRDAVWTLYASAIRRIGPRPTLIEWDNDVPAWPTLLDEARRAEGAIVRETVKSPERVDAV